MKTMLFAALVAGMLNTNVANATTTTLGGTKVEVNAVKKEKSFILSLTQIGNDVVWVKLENADGDELMTERVKGGDVFRKKYVLRDLPDGIYYLTLSKTNIRTVQPIEIINNSAELVEAGKMTHYEPMFKATKGDKVDINAMFPGYVKAEVTIMDGTGVVVFKEALGEVFILNKRYNVSELAAGTYTMELKTPTESYAYSFEKKGR